MDAPPQRSDVVLALLAYLPVLFLVPLLFRGRGRFVIFHVRQGLYLFSVFLVLFVVFAGLFYVFVQRGVFDVAVLKQTLAVLIVLTVGGYVVAVLWMLGAVLRRRMVMMPVLGDLAGER